MQTIEKTIEVERPVSAVYDLWTRFQDFPQFMTAIKEVRVMDGKRQQWRAVIGGQAKSWLAEILEQIPDQRLRWRSTSGVENSGTITFISLTPTRTRVILYLAYKPKGFMENLGANLGLVASQVAGDLSRFKAFMETRVAPTKGAQLAGMAAPAGR
jgi:uncharacterized membrane protein